MTMNHARIRIRTIWWWVRALQRHWHLTIVAGGPSKQERTTGNEWHQHLTVVPSKQGQTMDRAPTTGVLSTSGNGMVSDYHWAHPFRGGFIIFYLCSFSDVLHYASDIHYMYETLTRCAAMHNLQVPEVAFAKYLADISKSWANFTSLSYSIVVLCRSHSNT